jgi:hypothetical protein
MAQRLHANELLDEILNVFETNLKTALNLNGVYRGTLAWLPPSDILQMVNGIWSEMLESSEIKDVAMPKGITVTYRIRCVYVRRIDVSNNVAKQRIADAEQMVEQIFNNYLLATINPPLSNGQVLWWLPRLIEWYPPEDEFVQALSADLTAIACNTELEVRTSFR